MEDEYLNLNALAKVPSAEKNKEVSNILKNSVKFGVKVVASSINQEISDFRISSEDIMSAKKKKNSAKNIGFSYDCCAVPDNRKVSLDMQIDASNGIRSNSKYMISRTSKIPSKNHKKLFKEDDFILEEDDDEFNDMDGLKNTDNLALSKMKSCALEVNFGNRFSSILSKLGKTPDSDSD